MVSNSHVLWWYQPDMELFLGDSEVSVRWSNFVNEVVAPKEWQKTLECPY